MNAVETSRNSPSGTTVTPLFMPFVSAEVVLVPHTELGGASMIEQGARKLRLPHKNEQYGVGNTDTSDAPVQHFVRLNLEVLKLNAPVQCTLLHLAQIKSIANLLYRQTARLGLKFSITNFHRMQQLYGHYMALASHVTQAVSLRYCQHSKSSELVTYRVPL